MRTLVVQEVLSHTRVTTERHTHVAARQVKDAIERTDQARRGRG